MSHGIPQEARRQYEVVESAPGGRMHRLRARGAAAIGALVAATFVHAPVVVAQKTPTIAQFLSAPYPFELVSARKAERIAWLAYEEGKRNVYTAAAPGFVPVRLTSFMNDDGT